ncbi:hypothetical protein ANAPH2_00085 [Anaplasma phagocytophilum]|nr:hypothetical protein ANAPH2_00085 [Anaplasma phagocytophilum]
MKCFPENYKKHEFYRRLLSNLNLKGDHKFILERFGFEMIQCLQQPPQHFLDIIVSQASMVVKKCMG